MTCRAQPTKWFQLSAGGRAITADLAVAMVWCSEPVNMAPVPAEGFVRKVDSS